MFLHLGADITVSKKNIIAIMDLDNTSTSKITREYLKKATDEGRVININTEELPKSYIITEEDGERRLYVSPISSKTLEKRAQSNNAFDL